MKKPSPQLQADLVSNHLPSCVVLVGALNLSEPQFVTYNLAV